MTDRELMQQALEALEFIGDAAGNHAIAALNERLAQPEQVEWVETEGCTRGMRLRDILNPPHYAMAGTVQWHTNKPVTSNPVFEVRQL